jgi:hypothetical protein
VGTVNLSECVRKWVNAMRYRFMKLLLWYFYLLVQKRARHFYAAKVVAWFPKEIWNILVCLRMKCAYFTKGLGMFASFHLSNRSLCSVSNAGNCGLFRSCLTTFYTPFHDMHFSQFFCRNNIRITVNIMYRELLIFLHTLLNLSSHGQIFCDVFSGVWFYGGRLLAPTPNLEVRGPPCRPSAMV